MKLSNSPLVTYHIFWNARHTQVLEGKFLEDIHCMYSKHIAHRCILSKILVQDNGFMHCETPSSCHACIHGSCGLNYHFLWWVCHLQGHQGNCWKIDCCLFFLWLPPIFYFSTHIREILCTLFDYVSSSRDLVPSCMWPTPCAWILSVVC